MKTPNRFLIVSLHDVAAPTLSKIGPMLAALEQWGVDRTSLLVVPDYHGRGEIYADPFTRDWIRTAAANGHETVLHGLVHLRVPRGNEGLTSTLITQSYTAGEGEFYDATEKEAADWIGQGEEIFQLAGISARGFIAPAWLCSQATRAVLRQRGYRYTVLLKGVLDLQTGHFERSQSCVWSTRTDWRRKCSVVWNRLLFSFLQRKDPRILRVSLHPNDFDDPPIKAQIAEIIRQSLQTRVPTTYGEFCAGERQGV
ncbi:MAG: polysaccharide deacetylase family protein [Verrucomicrobiae bacterium]|nr:polysaccharide deacetylase family protein [Verrucomicrobiae bacterium]